MLVLKNIILPIQKVNCIPCYLPATTSFSVFLARQFHSVSRFPDLLSPCKEKERKDRKHRMKEKVVRLCDKWWFHGYTMAWHIYTIYRIPQSLVDDLKKLCLFYLAFIFPSFIFFLRSWENFLKMGGYCI